MAKLYTEDEIKVAMEVGVGIALAGENISPAPDFTDSTQVQVAVTEALAIFAGGHGREIPNYALFKELHERRDWRGMAEAHLAAGLMADGDVVTRHAALGQLAATLALGGDLGDMSRDLANRR